MLIVLFSSHVYWMSHMFTLFRVTVNTNRKLCEVNWISAFTFFLNQWYILAIFACCIEKELFADGGSSRDFLSTAQSCTVLVYCGRFKNNPKIKVILKFRNLFLFSRKTAASWTHIYFHFTNFNTQIKSGFQKFSAFSFLLPEHTESLSDYLITVVPGIPNILDESLTW